MAKDDILDDLEEEMDFDINDDPLVAEDQEDDRTPTGSLNKFKSSFIEEFTYADPVDEVQKATKEALPEIVGDNASNVIDIAEDFKDKVQESTEFVKKKSKPLLDKLRKSVNEDSLFGSLVHKAYNAMYDGEEQSRAPSKEELLSKEIMDNITKALGAEQEANVKKELFSKYIENMMAKSTDEKLANIAGYLDNINIFNNTVARRYFVKSLELKYRHFYLARDTHSVLAKGIDGLLKYLEAISKNTSLPDFVKLRSMEALQSQIRQNIVNKSINMFTSDGSTFDRAKKAMLKNIEKITKNAGEMIDGVVGSLGMTDDLSEIGSKESMAAGSAADFVKAKLARLLGREIRSTETGRKIDEHVTRFTLDPYAYLKDRAENTKGFRSKTYNFFANLLKEDNRRDAKVNIDSNDSAVIFDKKFYKAVTHVIPEYLARILQATEKITGNKTELLRYDYDRDQLLTPKEIKTNIHKDIKRNIQNTGIHKEFIQLVKNMQKVTGIKLTKKEVIDISDNLFDFALTGKPLTYNMLEKNGFFEILGSPLGIKFKLMYKRYMTDEEGNANVNAEKRVVNTFNKLKVISRHTLEDYVNKNIDNGFINEFRDMGVVSYDDDTMSNKISIDRLNLFVKQSTIDTIKDEYRHIDSYKYVEDIAPTYPDGFIKGYINKILDTSINDILEISDNAINDFKKKVEQAYNRSPINKLGKLEKLFRVKLGQHLRIDYRPDKIGGKHMFYARLAEMAKDSDKRREIEDWIDNKMPPVLHKYKKLLSNLIFKNMFNVVKDKNSKHYIALAAGKQKIDEYIKKYGDVTLREAYKEAKDKVKDKYKKAKDYIENHTIDEMKNDLVNEFNNFKEKGKERREKIKKTIKSKLDKNKVYQYLKSRSLDAEKELRRIIGEKYDIPYEDRDLFISELEKRAKDDPKYRKVLIIYKKGVKKVDKIKDKLNIAKDTTVNKLKTLLSKVDDSIENAIIETIRKIDENDELVKEYDKKHKDDPKKEKVTLKERFTKIKDNVVNYFKDNNEELEEETIDNIKKSKEDNNISETKSVFKEKKKESTKSKEDNKKKEEEKKEKEEAKKDRKTIVETVVDLFNFEKETREEDKQKEKEKEEKLEKEKKKAEQERKKKEREEKIRKTKDRDGDGDRDGSWKDRLSRKKKNIKEPTKSKDKKDKKKKKGLFSLLTGFIEKLWGPFATLGGILSVASSALGFASSMFGKSLKLAFKGISWLPSIIGGLGALSTLLWKGIKGTVALSGSLFKFLDKKLLKGRLGKLLSKSKSLFKKSGKLGLLAGLGYLLFGGTKAEASELDPKVEGLSDKDIDDIIKNNEDLKNGTIDNVSKPIKEYLNKFGLDPHKYDIHDDIDNSNIYNVKDNLDKETSKIKSSGVIDDIAGVGIATAGVVVTEKAVKKVKEKISKVKGKSETKQKIETKSKTNVFNKHKSKPKVIKPKDKKQLRDIDVNKSTVGGNKPTLKPTTKEIKDRKVVVETMKKYHKEGKALVFEDANAVRKTKVNGKTVTEVGIMKNGKFKTLKVLKSLPVMGIILGAGFAALRITEGDLVGAALEVVSGFAPMIPFIGVALSIGINGYLVYRDINGNTGILSDIYGVAIRAVNWIKNTGKKVVDKIVKYISGDEKERKEKYNKYRWDRRIKIHGLEKACRMFNYSDPRCKEIKEKDILSKTKEDSKNTDSITKTSTSSWNIPVKNVGYTSLAIVDNIAKQKKDSKNNKESDNKKPVEEIKSKVYNNIKSNNNLLKENDKTKKEDTKNNKDKISKTPIILSDNTVSNIGTIDNVKDNYIKKIDDKKIDNKSKITKDINNINNITNKSKNIIDRKTESSRKIERTDNKRDSNENNNPRAKRRNIKSIGSDFFKKVAYITRYVETNDKYNRVVVLKDGAGISFGAYQFTQNSGNLYKILKLALSKNPPYKSELIKHLKLLKGTKYKGDINKFKTFLKTVGATKEMKWAQDEMYKNNFYKPALNKAKKKGFKNPLTVMHIIDSKVNGGFHKIINIIREDTLKAAEEARIDYWKSLGSKWRLFKRGWLNRLKKLRSLGIKYLTKGKIPPTSATDEYLSDSNDNSNYTGSDSGTNLTNSNSNNDNDNDSTSTNSSFTSGIIGTVKGAIKSLIEFFGVGKDNISATHKEGTIKHNNTGSIITGDDDKTPGSGDDIKKSTSIGAYNYQTSPIPSVFTRDKQGHKRNVNDKTGKGLCGLKRKIVPVPKVVYTGSLKGRRMSSVDNVVWHYTAGSTLYLGRLESKGIGTQLWIKRDGSIVQIGDDLNLMLYHVGGVNKRKPEYRDKVKSSNSIGVEVVNPYYEKLGRWGRITKAQEETIKLLAECLNRKYGLTKDDHYYHEQVAYKTKDEGKIPCMLAKGVSISLPDDIKDSKPSKEIKSIDNKNNLLKNSVLGLNKSNIIQNNKIDDKNDIGAGLDYKVMKEAYNISKSNPLDFDKSKTTASLGSVDTANAITSANTVPIEFLRRLAYVESSGGKNKSAMSGKGKYTGMFQFSRRTAKEYLDILGKTWDDYNKDPKVQEYVMNLALKQYIKDLQRNNIPISNWYLWVRHNLGISGAIAFKENKFSPSRLKDIINQTPNGLSKFTPEKYKEYYSSIFNETEWSKTDIDNALSLDNKDSTIIVGIKNKTIKFNDLDNIAKNTYAKISNNKKENKNITTKTIKNNKSDIVTRNKEHNIKDLFKNIKLGDNSNISNTSLFNNIGLDTTGISNITSNINSTISNISSKVSSAFNNIGNNINKDTIKTTISKVQNTTIDKNKIIHDTIIDTGNRSTKTVLATNNIKTGTDVTVSKINEVAKINKEQLDINKLMLDTLKKIADGINNSNRHLEEVKNTQPIVNVSDNKKVEVKKVAKKEVKVDTKPVVNLNKTKSVALT